MTRLELTPVASYLADEQGVVKWPVSSDETVHEWAVELFSTCRGEARPLAPDELATDHAGDVT